MSETDAMPFWEISRQLAGHSPPELEHHVRSATLGKVLLDELKVMLTRSLSMFMLL